MSGTTNVVSVVGSGSTLPLFAVQGSLGELFSVTDSLTGSLFSVNDISGLPILEVFSDNTITAGDYTAPALITTDRVTIAASGTTYDLFTIPSTYDTAFVDYTVRSSAGARAGQIASTWSGSTIVFNETTTTDIGSTTPVSVFVRMSGSTAIVSTSATTTNWVVKTILRGI